MGGQAQKISQGGSDWYLRFRSERDLDRPETVRFEVRSKVRQRYSVTTITRQIYNPANVSQGFEFAVMIPSSALISQLEIGDSDPRLEAADNRKKTNLTILNQNIFHQNLIGSQFTTFVLPILLGPRENASLSITYEERLEMKQGLYFHKMFLRPGEIVHHFSVQIEIVENYEILDLGVHASVLGDISNETVVKNMNPNHGFVNFTMNTREQAHHFGSKGFYGTVGIQYSLNKSNSDMELLIQDNYFVHFYDIPEDKKHVIVVIDDESEEYLDNMFDEVIKFSKHFQGNSIFSLVYIDNDKAFLWSSTQNEENLESLENFIKNLVTSSQSIILPVDLKDLNDRLFRNISLETHMFHLKTCSNKEDKLGKHFDSERLSKISVHQMKDLAQVNKVTIDYSGDLVDQTTLSKTGFSSFPKSGQLIVVGRLKGREAGSITAHVSSLFHTETLVSSPISPLPCSGSVTLCQEDLCTEYTESAQSLPAAATVSAWTGNCSWTLYSLSNYLGDWLDLPHVSPDVRQGWVVNSIQMQPQWHQEGPEESIMGSKSFNSAENLHDFVSLENLINKKVDEHEAEQAINISLKHNFITPFTQLVLKDENSELLTYSYDDLLSPLLQPSPCLQPQDICDNPRTSSCPPLSVTSEQEGEVLISGSHPNLNLGSITQATQEGACCWIFFSLPDYAGDMEQFCGGEDEVHLDRIGSVKPGST